MLIQRPLSKQKRMKRRFYCLCADYKFIINTSLGLRHKYTLFISADGNFRLQRKHKKDDPDDVALNEGRSYFVQSTSYKMYLTHVGEGPLKVRYHRCRCLIILNHGSQSERHLQPSSRKPTPKHDKVQECRG